MGTGSNLFASEEEQPKGLRTEGTEKDLEGAETAEGNKGPDRWSWDDACGEKLLTLFINGGA
jgi:hypothetical protein